jgi:hypothetical protein
MADTTSNEGRTIATKGSSHQAVALAPDMCFVPGLPPPLPFPNIAPSQRLAAGQTTRTQIGSQPIVTSIGQMGPPSDPAHAGVLGGASSGTYRFEAQATTFSKDVHAEGNPVVRALDFTSQNHRNTFGIMVAGAHSTSIKAMSEDDKKKCTITKIEGTDGKRQLGYPGKKKPGEEPTYLEILQEDTVTFTSHRHDITKYPNEEKPDCQRGPHTQWTATTMKKLADIKATKGPEVGETFKVEGTFALDFVTQKMTAAKKAPEEEIKADTSRDETDWKAKKQAEAPGGSRASQLTRARINRERDAYRDKTGYGLDAPPDPNKTKTEEQKKSDDRNAALKSIGKGAYAAVLLWLMKSNPPTIDVEALGCGGPKTALIKVFPGKKFTFEFDLGAPQPGEDSTIFGLVRSACAKLKGALYIAEKLASLSGQQLAVRFMQGFKLSLTIEYKKCTQEKKSYWGNDVYTQARVNRTWELAVSSNPLIGANGKFNISLLNFAIPYMGQTVGEALRRFKIVRADLFFSVAIGCNVSIAVGQDEYDFPTKTGAKVAIDINLAMGVVLGTAGIDVLQFRAFFPGRLAAGLFLGDRPGVLLQLVPEGSVAAGFELALFPDRWYEYKLFTAYPPKLRYNFEGKRIDMLTMPS